MTTSSMDTKVQNKSADKTCSHCEFKCFSQRKLNYHMLVHSGNPHCPSKHRLQAVFKRHAIAHTKSKKLRNCEDNLDEENVDRTSHNENTIYKNKVSGVENKTPVILLSRCNESNRISKVDNLHQKDLLKHLKKDVKTEESNMSHIDDYKRNNKIVCPVSFDQNKFCLECNYGRRTIRLNNKTKRNSDGSLSTESVLQTITVKEIVFKRNPEIKVEHVCDQCSFRSVDLDDFEKHIKTHIKTTPFPCDYCEFFASGQSSLLRHKRLKHNIRKTKPFKCHLCGFRFAISQYLKNHMQTHLKFKAFACDRCDFRTKTKLGLKKHTDRHDGIKPFSCNVCNYRCDTKSYLKTHSFIHTGKTKYMCNVCDYKAALKSTLQRHMKVHNN